MPIDRMMLLDADGDAPRLPLDSTEAAKERDAFSSHRMDLTGRVFSDLDADLKCPQTCAKLEQNHLALQW